MNRNLQTLSKMASALLLSVAFSSCTLTPKTPSPELSERIEAARNRSDHEGLVAYYQAEAAAARETVDWHRRLAASYESPSGGGADPRMAAHCKQIAQMYQQIAAEYDGMAQFHQLLAREPALSKP